MKIIKFQNLVREYGDVSFTEFVTNQGNEYWFNTDLTELDTTTILGERRLSQSDPRDLLLSVSSFFANFACVSWKCVWLGCGWPLKFLNSEAVCLKVWFSLTFYWSDRIIRLSLRT